MVGGMEKQNYELITNLSSLVNKSLIALKKSQINLIWFLPYALIKSIFTITTKRIDIIHLGDGLLAPIGLILKFIFNKKVIVTVHGLDITLNNRFYQLIVLSSLRKLDKIICVSNSTRHECLKRKVNPNKCVFIPNGIESGRLSLKTSRETQIKSIETEFRINLKNKKILLSVGRLVKRKGVYWFIDNVMSMLGNNTILIVVGDGPEKARIARIVNKKKLKDNVFLLGRIEEDSLKNLYNAADIFVMPNIKVKGDMEGFGIVAIEAASLGIPVVASGIEGIKDAIHNEKNGYLVNPYDAKSFTDKIKYIFKNEKRMKSFSLSSKKFTHDNYDWKRINQLYYQEFKKTLGETKK
jgi:phosphatidylinositol alpha-1,6-mannosyltransferase